jgi:predicted CopG family antitoxin
MVANSDKTTIQISKDLRERLVLKKRGNDTYDDVIEKLIINTPENNLKK